MGAELFHSGGRTDTMKLTVALRYFVNAPKNRVSEFCIRHGEGPGYTGIVIGGGGANILAC